MMELESQLHHSAWVTSIELKDGKHTVMKSELSLREISREQDTNSLRRRPRRLEFLIRGFLFFCGAFSILTTFGIFYVLGKEALLFFRNPAVDLIEFFTGTKWQPQAGAFGVLPLVNATLMTTATAMLIALPLGLAVAIYLSEYASTKAR